VVLRGHGADDDRQIDLTQVLKWTGWIKRGSQEPFCVGSDSQRGGDDFSCNVVEDLFGRMSSRAVRKALKRLEQEEAAKKLNQATANDDAPEEDDEEQDDDARAPSNPFAMVSVPTLRL
jgi:hypothetical protein